MVSLRLICRRLLALLIGIAGALVLAPQSAGAAVTWPTVAFDLVAGGFDKPVHVAAARDGSGRIFVVERRGRIKVIAGGVVQPTPYLDIAAQVLSRGNEQGLLSVAFPMDFATKRHFYVDYTAAGGGPAGKTVVSRFSLNPSPDDSVNVASEEVLLTVDQPFANHNGGQLAFGPDGFLYIGMGDGGSAGDPGNRAQRKSTRLGKLLRIDAEASTPTALVLPAGNPFVGVKGDDAIWAYGLRNPWRFSFDRQTGDLYIGDVGQNAWEEVDFQPAGAPGGANYGWNRMEGRHPYPPGSAPPPFRTVLPVSEYSHGDNDSIGCSVSGGFVYRGSASPALAGIYLFGDFCRGKVWGLQRDAGVWRRKRLAVTPFAISTFGEDDAGEVYVADYVKGAIYRIRTP